MPLSSETPSDTLHRTASLLLEKAAATTQGPWRYIAIDSQGWPIEESPEIEPPLHRLVAASAQPGTDSPVPRDFDATHLLVEHDGADFEPGEQTDELVANLKWMEMMSPPIAISLAAVLESEARRIIWAKELSQLDENFQRTTWRLASWLLEFLEDE